MPAERKDQRPSQVKASTRKNKVFKACTPCRERKVSCDGALPGCSRCVKDGVRCEYRAVRNLRGPGKKQSGAAPSTNVEAGTQAQSTGLDRETSESDEIPLQNTSDLQSLCRNIYPVQFDPGKTSWTLEELKYAAREDQKSHEGFTSLVHKDVFQYMLANTYNEVAALCPIFDLATLKELTKEQQSLSVTHPSGNPARWAILSTWIALALRFRTARGSEGEYFHVIKSYYRNATLVLSDLILQTTTLQNIQALLFMAILAEVLGDHRSLVMLVTNAARQTELMAKTPPTMLSSEARELYERLLSFSRMLDRKVAQDHSVVAILTPNHVAT